MLNTLLTAAEMAKQLKMSVKTFYRRVKKYEIPFIDGRQPLYDPEEVLRCLKTTNAQAVRTVPTAARRFVPPNKKYRKILGLE